MPRTEKYLDYSTTNQRLPCNIQNTLKTISQLWACRSLAFPSTLFLAVCIVFFSFPISTLAEESALDLRVGAWNLEHLDDSNDEGCVSRTNDDYAALAQRIEDLGLDVLAFQEVENLAAARRVFSEKWNIEISNRPMVSGPPCRENRNNRLGHLATGIAVRDGLEYHRNPDLTDLDVDHPSRRWGTDITIIVDNEELRVLSVHLKSGCWSKREDTNVSKKAACTTLREQIMVLKKWIAERHEDGQSYVIVGDFNRRFTAPDDWAWELLTEKVPTLALASNTKSSICNPKYPLFIDHIIFDSATKVTMVPGSFEEVERVGKHPDHCAISARFSSD
ncbi:MAG: hypothetical protein F4073_05035 [Rhodobacteraceae bacterium]|nr:hypothetical protein [Paracoccaceae bacterium]MYG42681.1 hypothetical protein [Paracoccaceae bacterium]MYI91301.1 hypothetical protein [Paracoccaceae bacterium]